MNNELIERSSRMHIDFFSVTDRLLEHLTLRIESETWDGVVCMCVSATLIILFIFQNTADLRQALVQPSRAQPPSTEPWDSSLPTEMTGTSSILTASSITTRTYTQNHSLYSQHTNFLLFHLKKTKCKEYGY